MNKTFWNHIFLWADDEIESQNLGNIQLTMSNKSNINSQKMGLNHLYTSGDWTWSWFQMELN